MHQLPCLPIKNTGCNDGSPAAELDSSPLVRKRIASAVSPTIESTRTCRLSSAEAINTDVSNRTGDPIIADSSIYSRGNGERCNRPALVRPFLPLRDTSSPHSALLPEQTSAISQGFDAALSITGAPQQPKILKLRQRTQNGPNSFWTFSSHSEDKEGHPLLSAIAD